MIRGSVRVGRLRRDKGISVARPTALGNPFRIGPQCSRDEAIRRYRWWLREALLENAAARTQFERIVERVERGEDVTLLCWCAPESCHADAIAEHVLAAVAARSGPRV